jgi:hypothetical protein
MLNRENIKRNVMMLSMITSVLMVATIPVFGLDANTPAVYTVNYVIPGDTSFTITLCGSQTAMNFNPTNGSSKLVEPVCQAKATNTPWANITNGGNLNLNFSTNLTAANPSWVVLNIGSNPTMTDQIVVSNSALSPAGWLNVAPGNTVQLYSLANFTNAPKNTTSVTLNIHSSS